MGNTTKKAFPVLNMHCAGCANNVEKTVKKLPGVIEASVNFATNTLTVSYEKEQLTPGEIRAAVLAAGYDLIVEEAHKEERREELHSFEMEGNWSVDFGSTIVGIFHDTDACAIL